MHQRARLGRWGEAVAARWLRRRGWVILHRNWHCRGGEIDLVAWRETEWLFVEVKTRRSLRSGGPATAWTARQRQKLQWAIGHYIEQWGLSPTMHWRMALITVLPVATGAAAVNLIWPEGD